MGDRGFPPFVFADFSSRLEDGIKRAETWSEAHRSAQPQFPQHVSGFRHPAHAMMRQELFRKAHLEIVEQMFQSRITDSL
jgi:hypothetical protein